MSPSTDLSHLREEYRRADLDETDVAGDPIAQFRQWFDEARAAGVREANAMIVSTADAEGRPASRTLLLKAFLVSSSVNVGAISAAPMFEVNIMIASEKLTV